MRISFILTALCLSCSFNIDSPGTPVISEEFTEVWSRGMAEINVYHLTQARYGESHTGKMVLIFVKERVDPESHIKLEDQGEPGLEVLKCNNIRKFTTGIYDYSLMNTTMTGLQGFQSEKLVRSTTSIQDWCGHVFAEINLIIDTYNYRISSYFEGESDEKGIVFQWSEEAVLNQIRINPEAIPSGRAAIIPSMFYLRLRHKELAPEQALFKTVDEDSLKVLTIDYTSIKRKIAIKYTNNFPHEIVEMEESYQSGWGEQAGMMTTTAKRVSVNWLEYWKLHNNSDAVWRKKIEIDH